MKSIYQQLQEAGVDTASWGCDVFAPESLAIRKVIAANAPLRIERFIHNGRPWVCILGIASQ